jgi:hypothetical protein
VSLQSRVPSKPREVIASHYQEKVADIVMGEWLLYNYTADNTATSLPEKSLDG